MVVLLCPVIQAHRRPDKRGEARSDSHQDSSDEEPGSSVKLLVSPPSQATHHRDGAGKLGSGAEEEPDVPESSAAILCRIPRLLRGFRSIGSAPREFRSRLLLIGPPDLGIP